ncbi:ribonuclease MC-like [Momordica charantia]|uniref:Ribonuclease MC-like n=1 Tax=Momordica charantia TaxID=3673 RepID=A0A6J1DQN7_MOMCH|nr:ribonuclease MC-like [Momordica charantia]
MKTSRREIVFMFVLAITIFLPIVKSQTFDDFWFVQQWPPAVCSFQQGRCVGQGLRTFTIHGVWPQKGGTSVVNCPGTPFDFTKISSLETDLNRVWPNVITGDNKFFWSHEWNKHGVCSESKFNMKAYFQMAINMRNSIDLMNALKVGGLAPNGLSKSKQRVQSALRTHFGKEPVLRCRGTGSNIRLIEIVMCFDDDGVTLINCNPVSSNCANSFIF